MTDVNGTCEYVLDPDDPETWGGEEGDECYVYERLLNEDGVWSCPHNAEPGAELCLFHLPVKEKDDEEVVDAFLNALHDATETDVAEVQAQKLQFLGSCFGTFDLNKDSPEVEVEKRGILMTHAKIGDKLDWSDSKLNVPIVDLNGLRCDSDVVIRNTNFGGKTSFVGAEFSGDADFSGAKFGGEASFSRSYPSSVKSIEESGATFRGEVSFSRAEFTMDVDFSGTKFGRDVDFSGAKFGGEASFSSGGPSGAKFGGEVSFSRAEFRGDADFRSVEFEGDAEFVRAKFGGDCTFARGDFRQLVRFSAEFSGVADFRAVGFRGRVNFGSVGPGEVLSERKRLLIRSGIGKENDPTQFDGDVDLRKASFHQAASFSAVEFNQDVYLAEASSSDRIDFSDTTFSKEVDFREAELNDWYFPRADFKKGADFSGLDLNSSIFRKADLTESIFTEASLCSADLESALLSRATLFGADLRGAALSGAVFGDVRIDETTQFLGHPSENRDATPHTVSTIFARPCCVYDPNYGNDGAPGASLREDMVSSPFSSGEFRGGRGGDEQKRDKAKSTYRALEEVGRKNARPRLQSRCFVRRQDLQKMDYWNDVTGDDASLEERLIAGARWSRAKMARAALLYGESPWRVIAWSFGIILSFALLYPLGGWMKPTDGDPITYTQIASNPVEILNSVYYSTLTYTALGFGDFQPVGLGRLLTTLETGLGAVMLALLVFILGRRAAR